MRQFLTIARNAFMELVRQPVFLLLMTCSAVFNVFLAAVPYFGFGDDPKLVKDSTLALMLLSGLFGAGLNASASVAHESRSGTALAVLAKPVGRAQFLLAKYLGLAAALTVLTYVNALAALLASRMAYDAYGDADMRSFGIFCGLLALGYAAAGFINYFLRRPFVANAVLAVVVIPTLAICTGVFLLGLMSDYLFGRRAEPVWTSSLQTELNNPQLTGDQKKLLQTVVAKYDRNQDGLLHP